MNWDWELVRSASISISAAIAMVTFVLSTVSSRRARRAENLRSWQKIVIAELFQSKAKGALSFDEILRAYQSEANEYSSVKLRAGDLSRQALRRILVELINGRVLDQVEGDKYRLMTLESFHAGTEASLEKHLGSSSSIVAKLFSSSESMTDKLSQALSGIAKDLGSATDEASKVLAEVVNRVHDRPGTMRASDLILSITQDQKCSPALGKLQCNLAISGGLITEDDDGKLWPPTKVIRGSN